jgi:formate/nitrite transporter FocA (FNT family)
VSEKRRRELGDNDAPIEQELQETFDGTIERGAERLHRAFRHIALTGFFGGLDIGLGVMAYLAVLHETGEHLLAGLAFSVGLVALLLGQSELFTENFLMPVAALVARQGTLLQLVKLWGVTLVGNLAGGWLIMWIITTAFPQWAPTLVEAAHQYVDVPISLPAIALALLGGSTITLMTGMQQGTTSDVAKIVATVIAGFLLAGLGLFHSILDSLLIFGAIQSGADISYLQWLGWFGYTLLFNIVGGLALVTALRLVRTKELVEEQRASPKK